MPVLRRLLPLLVGGVVVVAGLAGLLALFQGRDDAGLTGGSAASGPGAFEAPSRERVSGRPVPPPTSGRHEHRNITSESGLDADALLTGLAAGNVVVLHDSPRAPAELRALQRELTGRFDPELAAAGQQVVVARWPGLDGVQALAWQRRYEARGPGDPDLRTFAEAWLGKGRGKTG